MEKLAKERFDAINAEIKKANSIAIYCHRNPDGDTLGCALALYFALTAMNKEVEVFCDGEIPEKYREIKGVDVVTLPNKRTHDLSFAVDVSTMGQLGGSLKSYLSSKRLVALDHHKSHEKFSDITYVDASAAACAEVVFEFLKYSKRMSDLIAESLFTGIVTDSGCFQFSSTTKRTHEIACELLEYDFDSSDVIYRCFKRISPKVFALKNRVYSTAKFYDDGKIGVITFRESDFEATGTSQFDTEGIITSIIDVSTVEVAFAISEVGDKSYKVSVRTKVKVDASDLASSFGGGGHLRAAGLRLNGFYEDVLDKLLKAARDRL